MKATIEFLRGSGILPLVKRERSILELYGYYEPYLQKLGSRAFLDSRGTVKALDIPSYVVQRAYREMRQAKFGGSIIEYLQSVSMRFTLWRLFVQSTATNPERDVAELVKLLDSATPEAVNFQRAAFDNPLLIGCSREFGDYAAKHEKKYQAPMLFEMLIAGTYGWWITAMKKGYERFCERIARE